MNKKNTNFKNNKSSDSNYVLLHHREHNYQSNHKRKVLTLGQVLTHRNHHKTLIRYLINQGVASLISSGRSVLCWFPRLRA